MRRLEVALDKHSYPLLIGTGLVHQASSFIPYICGQKVVIITNETVAPLYLQSLRDALFGLDISVITLPDGEAYKTLASFSCIMDELVDAGAARDTTLIALGGGVVGDLTGFAAACYQRGVPFIQVPTTLLAQVDASVGGKTAINHPKGKNLIGAFYQPQAVIIDLETLSTLPAREFVAGMAEVIKYGIIYDESFFAYLESHHGAIMARDPQVLTRVVARCCEIKAEIVAEDEREQGKRALLNFGHTFAHAIESHQGYGQWLHGEAVAAGMLLAGRLANAMGQFDKHALARLTHVLKAFSLPVCAPEAMSHDDFMTLMRRDKKVKQGKIHFVLPRGIGQAEVTSKVASADLAALFVKQ